NEFLGPFIIKQSTARKEAFDKILGIDDWRTTQKGTAGLLSEIQKRSEILAVEVAGKQEQLAVLPEKVSELATIRGELVQRQKTVQEKEKALALLDGKLAELETVEKAIAALGSELQMLEDRIKTGTGMIEEQKLRIEESQQAMKLVTASKAGKEAYDKVEIRLAELRRQEQQRRTIEQDIAGLEKQALTLAQKLEHERTETGKIDTQLVSDQEKQTVACKEL